MNPKNDNEKEIEGALEGGSESASEYVDLYDIARNAEAYEAEEATVLPESDDNGMVDLFALAADNDVPPAPAVEDIFVIQGDDTDEGIYPEGFEETDRRQWGFCGVTFYRITRDRRNSKEGEDQ